MPPAIRIAVDPHDLTRIRFLDPADNRFVEVPIQPSMLDRVRGVSLEKHKLARALQRANPEALNGDMGLARAYTMLDDAMREQGAANGMANRRDAARYWGALTRSRLPEEPAAFDTEASGTNVTDGLFGREPEVAPPPVDTATLADTDIPPATGARRERKPKAARREKSVPDVGADADDGDDLAAAARALGMGVRKVSEEDGR